MRIALSRSDRFGLVRPALDAHSLGLASVKQLLEECGYPTLLADAAACKAFENPGDPAALRSVEAWIRDNRITVLGFSYRLDPAAGAELVGRLVHALRTRRLLHAQGGPLKALYFAGLPETCDRVRKQNPEIVAAFAGDESPAEVLQRLGVEPGRLPEALSRGIAYDEARLAFGAELVRKGDYLSLPPPDRSGYPEFGTERDTLVARLRHARQKGGLPLLRAHAGPFSADRREAVATFLDWCRRLGGSGHLDVLSVGTSQLTQSAFGEDWDGRANGGGVPINSPEEFAAVWQAARPLLVRTYAGTRHIPALARMYEETLHIAWHALSLWWFCRIDGRGPYGVRENLDQHVETIRYAAATGKPFEPNVPHHFAFRGADDVAYVVSAVLAARLAKALGIRHLVLQNMLNTPRSTWGIQDLAKSRAMLRLVRELQDERFSVILQPRGGLDYFSGDPTRARAQLAAVTALMDDIEPGNPDSPEAVHVVSYSEGFALADPDVIDESARLTRHALAEYRRLRARGLVDDMTNHPEVVARTEALAAEARGLLRAIEAEIPNVESADGLYRVLDMGFLPVPYLWECREEFARAVAWETRLVQGAVRVVDEQGKPLSLDERLQRVKTLNRR